MIAGDVFLDRARPWLFDHRRGLTRALAPLLGLGLAWWLVVAQLSAPLWLGVICYGLAHLTLLGLERSQPPRAVALVWRVASWLYVPVDVAFALLLLSQSGVLDRAIYPLYLLIALRVLAAYQRQPAATITPFVLGPTYLFTRHMAYLPEPLAGGAPMLQWSLLLGSLGFGAVAIWSSAAQQRVSEGLRQELRGERGSREARVGELERTANDLRARMRELHALEEGLRVITSTLSLDEVLDQIVDSTVQMLGPARVHGMVLSLLSDEGFEHRAFMHSSVASQLWGEPLAWRVMRQEAPIIIGDAALDETLAWMAGQGLRSALCVPLFVGDGPARGALTIVSEQLSAFSSSDARHLIAFAIQAGIAIHNAEMHSRMRRQQQLLEAVVRDINDGLVVIDAHGQVVLTNPIGRELLGRATTTTPVREQLLALVASMRAEHTPTLMCDLRVVGEGEPAENEATYQALASRVHQGDDDDEPLIAVVLHDITAQKVEERTRTEFISMVSHELRNPLHSLNGFIKVVLQGRAGALTPLQREFLEIADGQIEQLKGRIAELLEFNRLEAGRLVLNPQRNHLPLLVVGTIARLRLQAEQAGLALLNEVDERLPECLFDSERVGQVLTNLIENAVKATPPGGTITVRSELHEAEIWVRVSDTGVGIPAEEQAKVFQRFYRAHNPASSQGNHLGLGLAICQQIIEGHHGRIWVESEEGRGSCFSFALPLSAREHEVG